MDTNLTKSVQAMLEQRKESINVSNIAESFGDYALNENTVIIRNKINGIIDKGYCSLSEMNDIISDIRESNLSEISQRHLVRKIFEAYSSPELRDEEIVEEGITLLGSTKFDGDPVKNNEYISLLKEMDKFVAHLVDLVESDFEIADDILKILEDGAKSAKKKEDLEKILSNCLNRFDIGNKKYDQSKYKEYYDKFLKFNKISRSFNNRYSKITMSEKKIIDNKFDKIISSLYGDIVKDWFKFEQFGNTTPKTEKLNEAYLKIKDIDRDSAINISNRVINPMYNYIAKCWSQTINNINYLRRILGIELEGTAKWKIVHKIFK